MTSVLIKRGKLEADMHTESHNVKMKAEICKPRKAKVASKLPEIKSDRQHSEITNPKDTLVLDFYSPDV